jgi:hypothetical protein
VAARREGGPGGAWRLAGSGGSGMRAAKPGRSRAVL